MAPGTVRADASGLLVTPLTVVGEDVCHVALQNGDPGGFGVPDYRAGACPPGSLIGKKS
jgi:hypothetical protein